MHAFQLQPPPTSSHLAHSRMGAFTASARACSPRRYNIGRMRSQGKIKSLEQIYLFSMPVKEYQIVEHFLGSALKDEVMKIMPVQKQTRAGQRTRFKVRVHARGGSGWAHACVTECA